MRFLDFIAGLAVGLVLLAAWQQYWQHRLKKLLQLFRQPKLIKPVDIDPEAPLERLAEAITSQQRLTRGLEQQLALRQQILDLLPLAYVQVDIDNHLVWANPQATRLLKIDGRVDEPLSDPNQPRLLLQIVRSYELDRLITQTRQTQQPKLWDWVYHPPLAPYRNQPHLQLELQLGVQIPLRGYGFPLANGDIGVFLENRQEAVLLKEERDRWISDVAHELKTPLTSMRLVAETLQLRIEPSLRVWVDRFLQETVRLGDLVQNLLELGRLNQNASTELTLTDVDLPQLIHNVWLSLEPLASPKQLQFCYQGPEVLHVSLDQPQFFRVLLNLLDNAIRYSPSGGEIQVRLSSRVSQPEQPSGINTLIDSTHGAGIDGEHRLQHLNFPKAELCLEVIDAGPGFAEVDLPHVFERFYRAEASRVRYASQSVSPHSGGSGLGLAIVQQIVTAHQGIITAHNHPEIGGGWLRIFLPIEDTTAKKVAGV